MSATLEFSSLICETMVQWMRRAKNHETRIWKIKNVQQFTVRYANSTIDRCVRLVICWLSLHKTLWKHGKTKKCLVFTSKSCFLILNSHSYFSSSLTAISLCNSCTFLKRAPEIHCNAPSQRGALVDTIVDRKVHMCYGDIQKFRHEMCRNTFPGEYC